MKVLHDVNKKKKIMNIDGKEIKKKIQYEYKILMEKAKNCKKTKKQKHLEEIENQIEKNLERIQKIENFLKNDKNVIIKN